MKALRLFKMSVIVYQLPWCSTSEDLNLHSTVFLYRFIRMKYIFSAENRYKSKVLSSSTQQLNPHWLPLFWPCHLLKCTAVTEPCKVWRTLQMVLHKGPSPVLAFLIYSMDFKWRQPSFTYQWLAKAPTLAMQPFITKLSHQRLTDHS